MAPCVARRQYGVAAIRRRSGLRRGRLAASCRFSRGGGIPYLSRPVTVHSRPMCTLVFGLGVLGPGSGLIATNRDEDPARGSEPPRVLRRAPLVLGGRDAVAGGTWLALRAGESVGAPAAAAPATPTRAPAVALLLNRHDPEPGRAG